MLLSSSGSQTLSFLHISCANSIALPVHATTGFRLGATPREKPPFLKLSAVLKHSVSSDGIQPTEDLVLCRRRARRSGAALLRSARLFRKMWYSSLPLFPVCEKIWESAFALVKVWFTPPCVSLPIFCHLVLLTTAVSEPVPNLLSFFRVVRELLQTRQHH